MGSLYKSEPGRGEEIWVKLLDGLEEYELGIQLNKNQYTYLTLTRAQLEQVSNHIHAALLEGQFG